MTEYQGKRFKRSAGGAGAAETRPGGGSTAPRHAAAPTGGAHRASQTSSAPRHAAPASAASQARPAGTRFAAPAGGGAAQQAAPAAHPAGRRFKQVAPAPAAHTATPPQASGVTSTAASHRRAPQAQQAPVARAATSPRPATPATGARGVRPSSYTHPEYARPVRGSATTHATSKASGNKQPRRSHNILSTVLIVVGVLLLAAAAGIFIFAQLGYNQASGAYDEIAKSVTVADDDGSGAPAIDFDALWEICPDVVGWIYIPNTNVNYPVVQDEDNTKYLRHLIDGTWNISGSVFMDCDQTAPGMIDQQTTLYGHHMNNNTMFAQIDQTTDQAAFDAIEVVYYITPDTVYRLRPLATTVVDDTYVEACQAYFGDQAALASYLSELISRADAKASDAEARAASAEQIMSLITCNYGWGVKGRAVMTLTLEEATPVAHAETGA